MLAALDGSVRFRADACPSGMLDRLGSDLSFPNPQFVKAVQLGKRPFKKVGGVWVPIDKTLNCLDYVADGSGVRIPRATLPRLRRVLRQRGHDLEVRDRRVVLDRIDLSLIKPLRPYQADAVRDMMLAGEGLVVMPCGGGKTVAGIGAIVQIAQPTIVLVHTKDLLEQWSAKMVEFTGQEPGMLGGGRKKIEAITIASVQTLARWEPEKLRDLGWQFGMVLVDEAHHAPAKTYRQVLAELHGKFRFGLTATPKREDGLQKLLDWYCGRIVYRIEQRFLVEHGYLQMPRIIRVDTPFTWEYPDAKEPGERIDPSDYRRCQDDLIEHEARNILVAQITAGNVAQGRSVMVLSGRKVHLHRLAEMLGGAGCEAAVMTSDVAKGKRREYRERFMSGDLRALLATQLADEGLDLPRADRMVLAFPGKHKGRTEQRLGRVLRPCEGKDSAILYDLVDSRVTRKAMDKDGGERSSRPFVGQYRSRSTVYRRVWDCNVEHLDWRDVAAGRLE